MVTIMKHNSRHTLITYKNNYIITCVMNSEVINCRTKDIIFQTCVPQLENKIILKQVIIIILVFTTSSEINKLLSLISIYLNMNMSLHADRDNLRQFVMTLSTTVLCPFVAILAYCIFS